MDKTKSDIKGSIAAAVIAAVLSMFITSIVVDWNRIDDAVSQEEMQTEIEKTGEDILSRSRRYTDDKINSLSEYQDTKFYHIEKIIEEQNSKYLIFMEHISNRLDRIDKRMSEKTNQP